MGKEGLRGTRLLFLAGSAALAAAGIYVGTAAEKATEEVQSVGPGVATASLGARVERAMLTAQLVASSPMVAESGSAPLGTTAQADTDIVVKETAEPQRPAEPANGSDLIHRPAEEESHLAAATPSSQGQAPFQAPAGADRDRMSPANVAARQIAAAESAKELQRMLGGGGFAMASTAEGAGTPVEVRKSSAATELTAEGAPSQLVMVDASLGALEESGQGEEPVALSSDAITKDLRRLLFVWDSSAVLDEAESAELIAFAEREGYNTLAVEAGGVGYGDAALTKAFERFTADATEAGIETFALIGYPWFTVAANAGIPGQPTSSLEGVAILDVIVATGLFDGVVDDSHPYGVVYEADGESFNRLFNDPVAASLDFQAWLRAAKAAVGELPLIKTTPFWYDTHPALQDLVNLEGEGTLALGHLVVTEVDAMAVLAYRDALAGPNGVLELVAGELAMGPSIITLETSDLGPELDFLTFHEEGFDALNDATEEIAKNLAGQFAFAGTGAHHYRPIERLAAEAREAEPFGFVALESANAAFGSLIDAYDSSLGAYTDQLVFAPELNTIAGFGEGAIFSNGNINLAFGALVHGNVGSSPDGTVTKVDGTRITGELVSIESALASPIVLEADTADAQRLDLQYRESRSISGEASFSNLSMNSAARLEIVGPATVSIDELRMNSDALILADTAHGPVTLLINDQLNVGSTASIAPVNGRARDFTIRYAGTRTIVMGFRARILAEILAPNATIEIGSEAEIFGRATARSLTVRSSAKLHLDLDLQR